MARAYDQHFQRCQRTAAAVDPDPSVRPIAQVPAPACGMRESFAGRQTGKTGMSNTGEPALQMLRAAAARAAKPIPQPRLRACGQTPARMRVLLPRTRALLPAIGADTVRASGAWR